MAVSAPTPRPSRFGLRGRPGRIALAVMRLPLRAYRHDAGWVFGETFVAFTHVGRRTGRLHEAVAMVLRRDAATAEVTFCAARGPDTDWYRNLRAGPAVSARIGRESFAPAQRFLSDEEAVDVLRSFRRHHPYRVRLICAVLGWGRLDSDARLRAFVRTHPFVALRPA